MDTSRTAAAPDGSPLMFKGKVGKVDPGVEWKKASLMKFDFDVLETLFLEISFTDSLHVLYFD